MTQITQTYIETLTNLMKPSIFPLNLSNRNIIDIFILLNKMHGNWLYIPKQVKVISTSKKQQTIYIYIYIYIYK